jgi:MOSC domain-containing protein YiiM
VAVNTNLDKEFRKIPREEGRLIEDFGLEGDRHAGRPLRQVSLLNAETLAELVEGGVPATPGILGENLTVESIPLMELNEGDRLSIGTDVLLEITGDRPACNEMLHVHRNALKAMVGRSGRMARVVRGGMVRPGDPVELIESAQETSRASEPGTSSSPAIQV